MLKHEAEDGEASLADPHFRADVLNGFSAKQRAIPARWLYDQRGSELFEAITDLPEYYPTRTETGILTDCGPAIAARVGPGRAVVEFGSGSSAKTPLLLRAIDPAAYVPIDISGDFLRASAAGLAQAFPGLQVLPVEADFMEPIDLPDAIRDLPKLGFFPGSTIGNLVPRTSVDLLRAMRESLGDEAMLLIGMDRVKGEDVLEPGVPESFKVLVKELQSLGLSVEVSNDEGGNVSFIDDPSAEFVPELGLNLSGYEGEEQFFNARS